MLVVLSPAKNLDTEPYSAPLEPSQPQLLDDAKNLAEQCKKLSPAELASLMKISDKLAILNAERFNNFTTPFTQQNAKPAVLTFNGDVYVGLDATTLDKSDMAFAQQHLRILSGLYGVLKPMDLMQAYRLEMGTKLKNDRGDNLYQYWGQKISEALNNAAEKQNTDVLVNLASNEYFKAVDEQALTPRVITPVFKDTKNGKLKVISFYAKKARGLMARYIIQHKITDAEQLKQFDTADYQYSASLSSDQEWVFTRAEQ
ncbi:peroxide stress protein YaaA [Alteromonas oceanisediminis]|uniref:peroxide stress protein YaaA n=1 Tax=Alteromonas oceanisediminis TaxID=2836180 RepID=UPI001BD9CA16|nr:peroxide stress protein YaaA [Alteromonas oceanisediminis]MBT0585488.1 peroxide stress protein YaaA [Alteromonas oceanisediminis]